MTFFSSIGEIGSIKSVLDAAIIMLLGLWAWQSARKARRADLNRRVEEFAASMERVRVARELHDHVGHKISALKLQLEIAHRELSENRVVCEASILIAAELADQARHQLRRVFETNESEEIDLTRELQDLGAALQSRSGVNVSIKVDDVFSELPVDTLHQIHSVAVEAIGNIEKHADARSVSIVGKQRSHHLILTIADDGRGFDFHRVGPNSFGLKGMHERATQSCGNFRIESSHGNGTIIQFSVPHLRMA